MKSMPIVGRLHNKTNEYMLVAIENVVNEPVDDWRLSDCLVAQKNDLVLEKGWNAALTEV